MLRVSAWRCRPVHGPFRVTGKRLFFWGYKHADMHRLARQRPWWENAAIFAGLLCFIQVTSVCYYFGNRLYHSLRPSGNDLYIHNVFDTKVFSRPDLAVAAVRMVIHHALSGAQTPFGAPMVYPHYMRAEAEELNAFVLQIHHEQPTFSIPDLWSMLTAKALARLGGPSITVRRGRPNTPPDLREDQLLVETTAHVMETKRDVLGMKRLLAGQGFSIDEIVALIGGIRTIGFHETSGFHTREEVKPQMRRRPNLLGPEEDIFHLPDNSEKCTLDPYVFGGEYFDLLLDYNWRQEGFFRRRGTPFRCKESDRKREVTLVDPFSEEAVLKEQRRLQAREKAREAVERAAKRREDLHDDVNGDASDPEKETSDTGRVGEAQFIPGVKLTECNEGEAIDLTDDVALIEMPEFKSPCGGVTMREMDMMLLDDALLTGWLYRFSANEIHFYSVFGKIVEKIQSRGYNLNTLYVPT